MAWKSDMADCNTPDGISILTGSDRTAVVSAIMSEDTVSDFDPRDPDYANQLRFTVIGLIFLFGIIPGFYAGEYGVLIVLRPVLRESFDKNIFVSSATVLGGILGVFLAAAVSVIIANLFCKGVRTIKSLTAIRANKKDTAETEM